MHDHKLDSFYEMHDVPIMLTVEEMGKLLRISRNTAYQFVRDGNIPYVQIGKQIRIYRGDVFAARKEQSRRRKPSDIA